jgi:hypothetical protein
MQRIVVTDAGGDCRHAVLRILEEFLGQQQALPQHPSQHATATLTREGLAEDMVAESDRPGEVRDAPAAGRIGGDQAAGGIHGRLVAACRASPGCLMQGGHERQHVCQAWAERILGGCSQATSDGGETGTPQRIRSDGEHGLRQRRGSDQAQGVEAGGGDRDEPDPHRPRGEDVMLAPGEALEDAVRIQRPSRPRVIAIPSRTGGDPAAGILRDAEATLTTSRDVAESATQRRTQPVSGTTKAGNTDACLNYHRS